MSLEKDELKILTDLLSRIDNKQITGEVWHALVKKFPTVSLELIILDKEDRVFLVYRNDQEFCGWHYPGSVWNDWETVDERLERLIDREIIKDAGVKITKPYPIGWQAKYKDHGTTRSTCGLFFVARLEGEFENREGYGFFAFSDLPKDTLPFHKVSLQKVLPHLFSPITLAGV